MSQKVTKYGKGKVKVWDVTLTVATGATSATETSEDAFVGEVVKIEIDPGAAMATSATLKAYEANTPLATGTRDHFLDFTFPASEVERVIYPRVLTMLNTGDETTDTYDGTRVIKTFAPYYVCDQLKIDLASAVAADATRVRIYVKG
jgi:hypothetical protein